MKKYLLPFVFFAAINICVQAQTILGVDLSHYDSDAPYGAENWTTIKATGKKFAWNKSTQGVTYTDPSFITNMVAGHAAGLIMGAYHFADAETNTAVAEANYFVSVAGAYIGPGYLPPVLDLEDPTSGPALSTYFTSAALTTWVQTFMTTVQNATGVAPIIYTDGNYAAYLSSSLNHYGLWIADPGTSATTAPATLGNWTTWAFKQYSWTGTVAGIGSNSSAQVDLDVFNGDTTAFNTLIGISNAVNVAFTSNIQTGCAGMQVTFTDHSTSTGTITAHSWTFTGGTPATSTASNPTVTYNTSGTYPVKEVVTSTTGKDSLIQAAYITVNASAALPLVQTFQTSTFPPSGWTMHYSAAGDSAWELCTNNGYNSSQCMYFPANCGYVTSIAGERQQIYTPNYSFVGTTNPQMWFDVAYEPYNSKYSDTLAIYYSLDCGTTWSLIYLKGGMTLCTTGSTDSLGTDTSGGHGCFVPPNIGAWRTDSINLSSLTGNSSVMFSIESRSGWGNILYLDNINVASTGVTCTTPAAPTVQASPGLTACSSVSLTATSSGCMGCTYTWSNSATAATISVTSTGTYSVTAHNSGCASTAGSVAVTVNEPPTITAGSSSQQICVNQPVTLTASGTSTFYQWSGSGLQTSTGASVSAQVANPGAQTYTVTGTLNGCTATASAAVSFNASVLPAVTILQTTSNPVCTGAAVNFGASSTNGGSNPVYQWTTSTGQTGTGTTFALISASNGETVKCLLISDANCAAPDSVLSNVLTVATQSPQPVTVTISTPDTNVCSGENIVITSAVINGGNSPVYSWYVNGTLSGNGSSYTVNNIQSATSVYCMVSTSSVCVTGSPATSNPIGLHIQNSTQASVAITASANPVCSGVAVTYAATPGNGGASPVFVWKLNSNMVGTNSPVYTDSNPQNGDVVSCSMTSSASCVSSPNVNSNIVTLTVNPLPLTNAGTAFHISPSTSVILGGNPTAGGGSSPYSYNWSPSTGLSATGIPNPIESGIQVNTIYTVVVTDANGCSSQDTVGIYLINCNLAAPVVQLNFCDLAAQNLPLVNYQWYLQNSMLTGATSRFYSAPQSGYYYVRVTDTVGCTAQSPDVFVNYPACLNTGLENIADAMEFEIYPNPAGNEITVAFSNTEGRNAHIEIIDLIGQTVYQGAKLMAFSGLRCNVNITSLPQGTYLIRLVDDQGRFVVKRLIKM